jgi:hypothetical protein
VSLTIPGDTSGFDGWAQLFTAPAPLDGVNWNAYTHEELYQMLWEMADVADVGVIADEWQRHSVALGEHAARLREQQTALGADWQGEAAELAATRLGELADRVDGISARAAANHQAAQQAADALALARAMLPPPPAGFGMPAGQPAPFALPSMEPAPFVPPSAPSFQLPSQPAPVDQPSAPTQSGWFLTIGAPPAPSGTGMEPAFGSVATSGSSMYFGDVGATQAKAQAVHAMQVYESSLRGGDSLISTGSTAARTYGVEGSSAAAVPRATANPVMQPLPGGVPWRQLTGGTQRPPEPGGSGRSPLGGGGRVGSVAPMPFGAAAAAAEHAAAARSTGTGAGMAPPMGQRGAESGDETHTSRMPVVDHGLFTVDIHTSAPVIGDTPGGNS